MFFERWLISRRNFFGLPLVALAFRDVREKDGDAQVLGIVDAEGVDVEPAPQELGVALEPDGLSGQGDPAVGLVPVLLEFGRRRSEPPAEDLLRKPRLLVEGRIGFEDAVVGPPVGRVEPELVDAEALVDGFEQRPVPFLVLARGAFGPGAADGVVGPFGRFADKRNVPREPFARTVMRREKIGFEPVLGDDGRGDVALHPDRHHRRTLGIREAVRAPDVAHGRRMSGPQKPCRRNSEPVEAVALPGEARDFRAGMIFCFGPHHAGFVHLGVTHIGGAEFSPEHAGRRRHGRPRIRLGPERGGDLVQKGLTGLVFLQLVRGRGAGALFQDPVRRLDGRTAEAAYHAFVVAQRPPGAAKPALFGVPLRCRNGIRAFGKGVGYAPPDRGDRRREFVFEFGPHVLERGAKRLGKAIAEHRPVGVVVERSEVRTPVHEGRVWVREHGLHGGPERLRPGCGRPEFGFLPASASKRIGRGAADEGPVGRLDHFGSPRLSATGGRDHRQAAKINRSTRRSTRRPRDRAGLCRRQTTTDPTSSRRLNGFSQWNTGD